MNINIIFKKVLKSHHFFILEVFEVFCNPGFENPFLLGHSEMLTLLLSHPRIDPNLQDGSGKEMSV